ncbi:MAG: hypothetical protein L6R42_001564 [Xanthoria sp. 1 TBL-2021]|nr:MAG: hypothetical protein L6R42_001564 [Xanthoria sp. 1 TBL-2021]
MAKSKYEYVKAFEQHPTLLPNTFLVVRIDGRGFHHLSSRYNFEKPNDRRALDLMNAAATGVLKELPDVVLAYGISDEYSFVFDRSSELFDRRESKILTTVVSTFTSYYIYLWPSFFHDRALSSPMPSFDGRVVLYPSVQNMRDYLSWRQADCHINNLYNTTFWALVQKGDMGTTEAEEALKGTVASQKHELLFSRFGINYNDEPEQFKKGSVLFRDYGIPSTGATDNMTAEHYGEEREISKKRKEKERKRRSKAEIELQFVDIIRDHFWEAHPWLLTDG